MNIRSNWHAMPALISQEEFLATQLTCCTVSYTAICCHKHAVLTGHKTLSGMYAHAQAEGFVVSLKLFCHVFNVVQGELL